MWRSFLSLFAACATVCTLPGVGQAKSTENLSLMDTGRGTKAPLVYAFAKGHITRWSFETDSQMAFAQMPKQALPKMTATIALTTKGVDAQGTGTFSATVEKATLSLASNPKAADLLKSINTQLKRLNTLKMSMKVDRHGRVFDVKVGTLKKSTPELDGVLATFNQQLQQVAVPLPKEPIGPSAKWRLVQKVKANNVNLTQETTYSLTRRNDATGEFSLSVQIRQSAKPQPLKLPGVPSNMKVRLIKADGEGKATMNVSRAYLGASGNVSIGLKMAVEMAMGSQTSNTAFSFDSTARLKASHSRKAVK